MNYLSWLFEVNIWVGFEKDVFDAIYLSYGLEVTVYIGGWF